MPKINISHSHLAILRNLLLRYPGLTCREVAEIAIDYLNQNLKLKGEK